jgi:nitrate reductase NapAB chaperone NapD
VLLEYVQYVGKTVQKAVNTVMFVINVYHLLKAQRRMKMDNLKIFKDKLKEIEGVYIPSNDDKFLIALATESIRTVEEQQEEIEQLKNFITSCEYDLTPEFRSFFPNGFENRKTNKHHK